MFQVKQINGSTGRARTGGTHQVNTAEQVTAKRAEIREAARTAGQDSDWVSVTEHR